MMTICMHLLQKCLVTYRKLTRHDLTFRDIRYIGFGGADRLLDGELHTVESSKVKLPRGSYPVMKFYKIVFFLILFHAYLFTYLGEDSCNVQCNKVVCQTTLFIVFLHAHFHCPQGSFMIHGELYRAIWAPFSDFGGGHCQGRTYA